MGLLKQQFIFTVDLHAAVSKHANMVTMLLSLDPSEAMTIFHFLFVFLDSLMSAPMSALTSNCLELDSRN